MSDPDLHAPDPHEDAEQPDGDGRLERTVGSRVRHYRALAGMTSSDLAERSGLPPEVITGVESATTSASLTTIQRISRALDVPVASLFRGAGAQRSAIVVKAGEGATSVRSGSREGHRYTSLGNLLSTSGPSLEPVIVDFNDDTSRFPLFEHTGIEFIYVLSGAVRFAHGDDEHVLRAGDSILLDAEAPHGAVEVVETPLRYLSVNPSTT